MDYSSFLAFHWYCGKPDDQRWLMFTNSSDVNNVKEVQGGSFQMYQPINETSIGKVEITVSNTIHIVGQIDGEDVDHVFRVLA